MKRYIPIIAVLLLAIFFVIILFCFVRPVSEYKELISQKYLTDWLSLSFMADGLSIFMGLTVIFAAFLVGLYSFAYLRDNQEGYKFYLWMILSAVSFLGVIFASNLMIIYCFLSLMIISSYGMLNVVPEAQESKLKDRSFLLLFIGMSLLLAGIALIFAHSGTLELSMLKDKSLAPIAAFLLLGGIFTISAQFPLHTWLADISESGIPAVVFLCSIFLVNAGVYLFARLFSLTFFVSLNFMNVVIILSTFTIILGAAAAFVQDSPRKILAYSTISQLGYVFLVLTLGSGLGFCLALVYVLAQVLARTGLFLCIGSVEKNSGTRNMGELGGLLSSMPWIAFAFLVCAFTAIGVPPFLGFWPKMLSGMMAIKHGSIGPEFIAMLGAILTLFYLMKIFSMIFLGDMKRLVKEDKSSALVYVPVIMALLCIISGLSIKPILDFLLRLTL